MNRAGAKLRGGAMNERIAGHVCGIISSIVIFGADAVGVT